MDDPAHRRIELQSPEDLTYLINNVRRAAADSINAAFPPVDNPLDGQEDELRNHIEQLVNDYITRTFTLASPNLTINGLPIADPSHFLTSSHDSGGQDDDDKVQVQYEYEPFDARKRDRIEQLVSEEEDLLRSIAQLKRRAPQATASRWAEAADAAVDADETALRAACERAAEEGAVGGRKALEGMGPLERQAEVEARFADAVATLGRLKRDMPAVVAKMERARVAAGYVIGSSDSK
ncbi:hypothetical protein VTI28DRAFT_8281 [Corynascus sepedonium]